MKRGLALFLVLATVSGAAFAHGRGGGRVHLGFHFGFPMYHSFWHYPPPYYYYPPTVVVSPPPAPPVYVERERAEDYWYYCEQERGYYPYVKQCPGGWKRVPPAPPPAQ